MTAEALFKAASKARDRQFGAIMAQKAGEAAILEDGVKSPVLLLPEARRLVNKWEKEVAFRDGAQ